MSDMDIDVPYKDPNDERHRDIVRCECDLCHGALIRRDVHDVHNDPEVMAGIRQGIEDAKAGRVTPWSELKRKYTR